MKKLSLLISPQQVLAKAQAAGMMAISKPFKRPLLGSRRDVIVTGTVIGSPGQESAMFQIEGMADRQFKNSYSVNGWFYYQGDYRFESCFKKPSWG